MASSQCDEASGQVIGWARSEGATESSLEALKTVLDEMLTNAFYHAPMDASGDPKFSKQDRSTPVVLGEGREVRMRWGVRGDEIAVEVADPYGTFSAARFMDHVKRGLAAGTADLKFLAASAGAGLGVFMMAQTATRLYVGIERGKRTSVICQVDMKARRKKLAEWIRSIHVVERA
jgi:anti-sigma regulatory factor (Ser/Thr protein kinase)